MKKSGAKGKERERVRGFHPFPSLSSRLARFQKSPSFTFLFYRLRVMFDIIEAKFCVNMLEIHFMTFCVMILNLHFSVLCLR